MIAMIGIETDVLSGILGRLNELGANLPKYVEKIPPNLQEAALYVLQVSSGQTKA
ncbi:hypothetical protein [Paenibacillus sp. N3.4]|uniref:hypothetical protein n=1 Tax=Paenibacillus sp. N3.4 TaxID=2603222 RepID=UPI00164FAC8E|nr:hypothetical protein [Paenibacillus sp. N3.4]